MLRTSLAVAVLSLTFSTAFSQQPAYNQNSARSNNARAALGGWNFGLNSGPGFAIGSEEKSLFRGNGINTRFNGDYNFGIVGIGFSGGFSTGSISDNSINSFLAERKIPSDQAIINSSKPSSTYLLAGPTFQFGKQIQLRLQLQGGLFINDPGAVSINQNGVSRPLYRFEAGKSNTFPGFSSALQLAYPIGKDLRFVIHTDYLYSKSSIRLIDLQQGIDVATEQTRNIGLFNTGVGIVKSFSNRNAGNGLPTGKRESKLQSREAGSGLATGRRQNVLTPREAGSGQSTGRRVLPTVNKRVLPTVNKRTIQETTTQTAPSSNCGPVTQRIEYPDGRSEQLTFSCPEDAVNYTARINGINGGMPNRISMNVTTPKQTQGATFGEKVNSVLQSAQAGKQTQGATFGEKVNSGLQAAGSAIQQGASLHIISGTLHWSKSGEAVGILSNKKPKPSKPLPGGPGSGAAAASYALTIKPDETGLQTEIHAREAGSGMATGRRGRETGSGMATGRRQYQPIYIGGSGTVCDPCDVTVKENPLYVDKGREQNNPLYKRTSGGPDDDCDGVEGITVLLVEPTSGVTIASTKTESCGDFWFANVPDGDYIVQLQGSITLQQRYDINVTGKTAMDIAGAFSMGDDQWVLEIHQQKIEGNKRVINTSRSNIKGRTEIQGDTDGDGKADLIWSPRTNYNDPSSRKLEGGKEGLATVLPVSLQYLDGEEGRAVVAGRKISDFGMSRKSNGTAQGASLVGGALPGGAIISAAVSSVALAPGNPIGGISIKGGKNGEGRMFNSSTNEFGEFEWTDVSAGQYTLSAEWPLIIDHETPITLGEASRKGWDGTVKGGITDDAASRKGWDGTVKGGRTESGSERRIGPDMEPDLINAESNKGAATRAQNNNTVRSNRGGFRSHIEADLDGDGAAETLLNLFNDQVFSWSTKGAGTDRAKVVEKATSGLKDCLKTQVRMAGSEGSPLIQWTSPELNNKVEHWGDPHTNEKDGRLYSEDGQTVLAEKGAWKATELGIRKIGLSNGACFVISATPGDLATSSSRSAQQIQGTPMKNATLVFATENCTLTSFTTNNDGTIFINGLPPNTDYKVFLHAAISGDEDILLVCLGNSVRVLKTKHDTAKNSISNIR